MRALPGDVFEDGYRLPIKFPEIHVAPSPCIVVEVEARLSGGFEQVAVDCSVGSIYACRIHTRKGDGRVRSA